MGSYESEAMENCEELRAYNHTELYQLCVRAGIDTNPGRSKEELVAVIEGTLPAMGTNPIDEWRYGIMSFLLEHWRRASSQLSCPAKSGEPDACHQCVDAQVIHCLTTNPRIESGALVHIRRRTTT